MFAAIGLMTCPNLAVPAAVMSHVVDVESGANPYAIGVVHGQLVRQPKNLTEALATVHMLDAKGYNYSLGIAQVNRANLGKYGLDTYEKAFDACSNLAAGTKILAACYAGSGNDWGKAFSCYYSGDFVTGYRDGYVQKVYDSINRNRIATARVNESHAIPLEPSPLADTHDDATTAPTRGQPGYRVSIRSEAFRTVPSTATPPLDAKPKLPIAAMPASDAAASAQENGAKSSSIFIPQVTGPNDSPTQPERERSLPHAPQIATAIQGDGAPSLPAPASHDAAFVF